MVGVHPEDHGGRLWGMADLWTSPSPKPAWSSVMDLDRRRRMHGSSYRGSGGGSHRGGPRRQREQGIGMIARLACPHITKIEKVIFVVIVILVVTAMIFGSTV